MSGVHPLAGKSLQISEEAARRRISDSDEQKRWYIRQAYDGADWKDPKRYHLTINTGAISTETAAQIIVVAVMGLAQT